MAEKPVAIVTAAGMGLGEAIARALAARDYTLVMMTRSDGAATLAKEIGGTALAGSVTVPADLERLVATTLDQHGRIDAVVNNTGHTAGGGVGARSSAYDPELKANLLELTDDDWSAGIDLILLNVIRMARLVTPAMERQGGGAILNMSSFAQKEPSAGFPLGACLRMALAGFTKLYADRYGPANIRMNNILPGFIENHNMTDALRSQVPMARPGTFDEVAKTATFLLSADAGYITGQSILLDGGMNRGL